MGQFEVPELKDFELKPRGAQKPKRGWEGACSAWVGDHRAPYIAAGFFEPHLFFVHLFFSG